LLLSAALLAPDVEGGPPREPLAADARSVAMGASGRSSAWWRGCWRRYDDLAQREAQRRSAESRPPWRVVRDHHHALGWPPRPTLHAMMRSVARHRRRHPRIMMGDLRKRLTTVGRLDLMRSWTTRPPSTLPRWIRAI